MDLFAERSLLIATKHGKETVIAPIIEPKLGVSCIIPKDFDSDRFGMFTGEIPRTKSPLETAKDKCRTALLESGYTLGIASEGSFGPHPNYFFLPANEEVLVLIDLEHNLEICAHHLSTETNFAHSEVSDAEHLVAFAQKAGFPEHKLILSTQKEYIKGIGAEKELLIAFEEFRKKSKKVTVQTDMRAMYNPMRMRVIQTTTEKLVEKIKSLCPSCQLPGFEVCEIHPGLPCSLCGNPTRSVLKKTACCKSCQFKEEVIFPQGKTKEDPMYCDYCNP